MGMMADVLCAVTSWTLRQRDKFLNPTAAAMPPNRNANYDACVAYHMQRGTSAANVITTCTPWLSVPDPDPNKKCLQPKYASDFRRRMTMNRLDAGRVSARLDKSPLADAVAEGPLLEVAEKMYRAVPERWPLGPTSIPSADDKKKCGRLALEEIKRHGMITEAEQAAITKDFIEKKLID